MYLLVGEEYGRKNHVLSKAKKAETKKLKKKNAKIKRKKLDNFESAKSLMLNRMKLKFLYFVVEKNRDEKKK